jgi:hypothetical protein
MKRVLEVFDGHPDLKLKPVSRGRRTHGHRQLTSDFLTSAHRDKD